MNLEIRSTTRLVALTALLAGAAAARAHDGGAEHGRRWQPTGPMHTPRVYHTATLLPDGTVLVAGGATGSYADASLASLATTERYVPGSRTFSAAASMAVTRQGHSATLLRSGKVLIAGGFGGPQNYILDGAELYDPATDSFAATGSLAAGRAWHQATLLQDGRVLVTGGSGLTSGWLPSAEIYDPASETFTAAGDLRQARSDHRATLLPGGEVLVTGGDGPLMGGDPGLGYYLASAELFHPTTGAFTAASPMATTRVLHAAVPLGRGEVVVVGGTDLPSAAERYDPATGTFATVGAALEPRLDLAAAPLPGRRVLVAGGLDNLRALTLDTAGILDVRTGAWTPLPSLGQPRQAPSITVLPSGEVLLIGGYSGCALDSAESYHGDSDRHRHEHRERDRRSR